MTRLTPSAHAEQPWRIHELTSDFTVEDVWAIRTPGAGPDDFPVMMAALRASASQQPPVVRFLMGARWKLGSLLGWDKPSEGTGRRVTPLRDRLPGDLLELPRTPEHASLPLTNVYELERESARELANKTVHAVMHLGWVRGADGDHELRMAVLVKPNGRFGRMYLRAILPFRYLIVYPSLTRQWERAWRDRPLPT